MRFRMPERLFFAHFQRVVPARGPASRQHLVDQMTQQAFSDDFKAILDVAYRLAEHNAADAVHSVSQSSNKPEISISLEYRGDDVVILPVVILSGGGTLF